MMFCSKSFVLERILNRSYGKEWGFEGGDKDWRIYIARFSYWEVIAHRAIELIKEKAMDVYLEDPSAPLRFFDMCQKHHLRHAFLDLGKELTPSGHICKMSSVDSAARRFVYR